MSISPSQTERLDAMAIDYNNQEKDILQERYYGPSTHLRLRDGLGYSKSFVKRLDENLNSLLDDYQAYSRLPLASLFLSNKGVLLDPHHLIIGQERICNGDELDVVINPARATPFADPTTNKLLLQLSPVNSMGFLYEDPCGPITRPDEHRVTALINDLWPGMPAIAFSFRALMSIKVEHVVEILQDCVTTFNRALHLTTEPTYATDHVFLSLGSRIVDTAITSQVGSLGSTSDEHEMVTLQLVVTNDRGRDQAATATLLCCEQDLVSQVLEWIKHDSDLQVAAPLLYHEATVLYQDNNLGDEGFKAGHTYVVRIYPSSRPTWLHAPTIKHGPVPHRMTLLINDPTKGVTPQRVIVKRIETLEQALRAAGYSEPTKWRITYDGHRFELSDRMGHVYRLTTTCDIDIHPEVVGGGPSHFEPR